MKIIKKINNEPQLQESQLKPEEIDSATETMNLLAEQLLELLLQQMGDPKAVMMVLNMAFEMLQNVNNEVVPIFRKGGKLIRK